MIPTFGPNATDPSLVYAWPTRRVMNAADCPVHAGVFLDPDAVDLNDPDLDAAILASLEGEAAATAPVPEVVATPDPAGGTEGDAVVLGDVTISDDPAAVTIADAAAQDGAEPGQDAIPGDSGANGDEAAAAAAKALESTQGGRRDHGRHGR